MLIHLWHSWLDMKKYDRAWHENDIKDELEELKEAAGWLHRWSEYSDIAYTYTRADWSGFKLKRPISLLHFSVGLIYMLPKYTLRWAFYRRAGKKMGAVVHEVKNPRRVEKIRDIAVRNKLDPDRFVQICLKQRRFWPLLK